VLWSIYAWVISTPGLRDRNGNLKGTDFLHFYTLGSLAIEHRGEALYDMNAQASLAARLVPAATGIRYLPLYPPQVSILFAPFAYFSYSQAIALWWAISALIYAACCYSIWRFCSNLSGYGATIALLAAAFPGFFHLIAWGQTSALALVCFTIAFLCFRKQQELLAGVSLGFLIFKPQLALAAAIFFLSLGTWQVIAGAIASAAVEISAGVLYYGRQSLLTWLRVLWHIREMVPALEPRPYHTHSLRTFWSMLIPWSSIAFALYIISAIVVLVWTIQIWKRSQSWELRFSVLLLATALVAPHLTVYDLVILVPAFLLLTDWLLGQRETRTANIGVLLYLVYMLPLFGFLSRWTHVQLSVLAMTALAYQIRNLVRSADFPHNAVSAGARLAQV
jgi:alpha-1,2-mannosyltransferase